ncbi:MAG: 50S ribosomal protein L22 [Balneolaceae bacterium]
METEKLQAKAVQRHLRRSARKTRLVANTVRGMNVEKAIKRLEFVNNAAAGDISKVIKSAAANIRDRFEEERLDNDLLYIDQIFVDEGVTLKRIRPRAMGRANRINKRSCHITVVVAKQQDEIVTEE